VTFVRSQVFLRTEPFTPEKKPKKELTIFGNTKQVIQDYDTLHFVPWHRGSGCLGAAAPVTGAAADEYNLNVVDCNASVCVLSV